jgi:hypothetical protein
VLHDASRPFCAEYALIDWVITISLDVADLTIFEVHIDSAATGAHVACGLTDLVADDGLSVNHWLGFHDLIPLHGWFK